jgi:hypothetical protein
MAEVCTRKAQGDHPNHAQRMARPYQAGNETGHHLAFADPTDKRPAVTSPLGWAEVLKSNSSIILGRSIPPALFGE